MTPAGPESGKGAARRGRPFFRWARLGPALAWLAPASLARTPCARAAARRPARQGLFAALLLAASTATPAGAHEPPALIAIGAAGARTVGLLECRDGRVLRTLELEASLAAPPALAPDAHALYLATRDRRLQRRALPGLALQAEVALEFEPLALAAAGGPDAIVLAGGRGAYPLSAHAPDSLELLQRYAQRDGLPATVSVLLDNPGRQGFAVAFSDLAEVWEIVYDRKAPPVLLGFVHDYRNNEAVPLPGRLTARPFQVASATAALVAGPVPWELARIDVEGRLGVISLELRREIERPALGGPLGPHRLAAWRAPAAPSPGAQDLPRERIARGWAAVAAGSAAIVRMPAVGWQPLAGPRAASEVLALAPAPGGSGRVLVAHRSAGSGVTVALLDPVGQTLSPLASLPAPGGPDAAPSTGPDAAAPAPVPSRDVPGADPGPADGGLRFVAASGGRCTALLDRDGRWLVAFEAADPAGALPFRTDERNRPAGPAETSSAPPRR